MRCVSSDFSSKYVSELQVQFNHDYIIGSRGVGKDSELEESIAIKDRMREPGRDGKILIFSNHRQDGGMAGWQDGRMAGLYREYSSETW